MDAFDLIFDEAENAPQPTAVAPRQNRGRANVNPATADAAPAPTTVPAKAGRPASLLTKPSLDSPVATQPAKAGKRKASDPSEPTTDAPSASTDPAHKAGGKKATHGAKTEQSPPSSPPTKNSRADIDVETGRSSRAKKGGGHSPVEIRIAGAAPRNNSDGAPAIGDDRGGHMPRATHSTSAEAVVIIMANWRMRQRWHKAEKSLVLQSKAICRGFCDGDKDEANAIFDAAWKGFTAARKGKSVETREVPADVLMALAPFLPAIARFEDERAAIEKSICKLAKDVPAYSWATAQPGIDKSFAWIVGEAGDIGSYKSVSALWKRMGLAVFNGERQRKKADAEEALLHGYNPSRRSTMWNVGGALIGGMGRGPRPAPGEDISTREDWSYWQKLFVERCRYECERDPEKFPLKIVDKGDEQRESYSKHCQSRAKRYVEKRFLRKLYAQWRLETRGVSGDPDEIVLALAAE